MACNCGSETASGLGEYQGLSGIDDAAIGGAFSFAVDAWNNLLAALGVGAGRREADVIVPLQNRLVSEVIAPASAYIDAVTNHGQVIDCTETRGLLASVVSAERQWLNYLHSTHWQDGRAATQAEATLAPYFADMKTKLQALLTQSCGGSTGTIGDIGHVIGGILTTPTGEMNWPVIALGVGAVFLIMRRK